jgi:DNA replication protein DnaD
MEEGWIKLHRKMRDWQWYTDIPVKTLFIHLLISANHTPKMWRGILVERGQFLTGRKALSDETGLSEMQVRSALKKLKNSGEITSKTTNKFTMITICNYNDYQKKEGGANQQDNQQITNEQPTNNQQITTNKNEKNEEEKKEAIELYRQCFRNLAPPGPVVVEIHSLVDDYGIDAVKEAFIAAGAERKSYTWAKSRMKNRKAEETTSNDIPYFEGYY